MTVTTESDMEKGLITDETNYNDCKLEIYSEIHKMQTSKDRFQNITDRKEESVFDAELVQKVSKGKYATCWRGISMMKDCLDKCIYEQLLWELRPRTVFETGAYTGACALWMANTMQTYGLPAHVYSMDINVSLVDPLVYEDKNVTIKQGDVKNIKETFSEEMLQNCPHPWMIAEDCHVDVIGVMEYFHKYMKKGDYFIIEDTSPDTPLVSGQGLLDVEYQMWGTQKLKLLKSFLTKYHDYYQVDTYYTDFYGFRIGLNNQVAAYGGSSIVNKRRHSCSNVFFYYQTSIPN